MKHLGYDKDIFLESLGSFWLTIFQDKDLLQAISDASELKISDEYFRFCEILLGDSVHDIPVFNKATWTNLLFKESQIGIDVGNFILYGDPNLYGDNGLLYGGKIPGAVLSFVIQSDIINIGDFICNKVYNPTLVLNKNKDFFTKNGVVHFMENLFDNSLVPIREITDQNGVVVDKEISLWVPIASIDKRYLWRKYGTLAGVFRESSEEYKTLLRNIFALFYIGPKKRYIEGFINQIYNLPVVKEEVETVNYIVSEPDFVKIYTDKNTYKIEPASAVNKEILLGSELKQFRPLTNVVELMQESTHPGWWRNRKYFSIPEKLLGAGFLSPVVVKSQSLAFQNVVGSSVDFPLYGDFTPDLKNELKQYTVQVGMGVVVSATAKTFYVDALEHLIGQIKDNLLGVSVDPTLTAISTTSNDLFNILNRVLPINVAYVMFMEIRSIEDTYDTETVTENIELLDGKTISDTILTEVDILDGYWGFLRVGTFVRVGSGYRVGEIAYTPYPLVQTAIKGS